MQQICDAVKALLPTAAATEAASVFTVKIKTKGKRGREEELSLFLRQQEHPSVTIKKYYCASIYY